MTQELQDFIAEARTPEIISGPAIVQAIRNYLAGGAKVGEQVARWKRMLQAAEVAETDPAVRPLYEQGFQLLGALEREVARTAKPMRRIHETVGQLGSWLADVEDAAGEG